MAARYPRTFDNKDIEINSVYTLSKRGSISGFLAEE